MSGGSDPLFHKPVGPSVTQPVLVPKVPPFHHVTHRQGVSILPGNPDGERFRPQAPRDLPAGRSGTRS
jgi:hypothetical protein